MTKNTIKEMLVYLLISVTSVRVYKLMYISLHNVFEDPDWPYLSLIFSSSTEQNIEAIIRSVAFAPLIETLIFYFFFLG